MNAITPDRVRSVASLRARLWDAGFRPLAIYNHDLHWLPPEHRGKRPKGDGWEERARRDPPDAAVKAPDLDALNTGILCDGLRAVDVDIDAPDTAARVKALAMALLGEAPMRWREDSPRVLLLYRATEGTPPKRVVTGAAHTKEHARKVEVLGLGQQFVGFGTHASGAALHWTPEAPGGCTVDSLLAVTEAQISGFLAAAAELIGAPPIRTPTGSAPALIAHTPSAHGPAADPLDVAAALRAIPNDKPADWEWWNKVGMAAWAATGGSGSGFAAWLAWSAKNPAHDPAACAERWQNYAKSPPAQIGAGTLFRLAQAARPGWAKPTAQAQASPGGAADPDLLANPDMTVLRLNRRAPALLPLDVFGPAWRQWIEGAAEAASCPPDYVATPLLVSASALIGNARWAEGGPGWVEPPHLWCCAVGDSSSGKSPGADALIRDVLPEVERRMGADFPDRLRGWKAAAEAHAAALERWKQDVRVAQKDNHAPPLPPTGEPPPEPQMPRLRQSDVTIEKVAALLATAAPKGLLLVRDELAGWLLGMNAYNDAGRAFWLEAYGGRPYRVERQKSPQPIEVPRLVVAVSGGTQPEKLAEMMREADDGLLARFCWFWPDPVPFRLARAAPATDWAAEALDRLRLLDLLPAPSDAPPRPVLVPLAAGAPALLEDFAREMQERQQAVGGLMRSAFGKARGTALRLALVLEYLWWCGSDGMDPPPATISTRAFTAAAHLVADYLVPMAERVYGDAAARPVDRNAATLARWIARDKPTEVHVRHVQRKVRLPGLIDAEAIHAAARELVDAGWLLLPEGGNGAGRPKAAYPVNPRVWEAAA